MKPETAEIAARFSGNGSEASGGITISRSGASRRSRFGLRLLTRPHPDLCTAAGSFRAYKKKGKWCEAAKRAGLAKADGDRLNASAEGHYTASCEAWTALSQAVGSAFVTRRARPTRSARDRTLSRLQARTPALLDFR